METSCSHRCMDSVGTFTGLRRWPYQACPRRRILRQNSRQLRTGGCCGAVKSMPIFPLNCVSFPSSAMPLNIFEARFVHLPSLTTISSPYVLRQCIYEIVSNAAVWHSKGGCEASVLSQVPGTIQYLVIHSRSRRVSHFQHRLYERQ